MGDREREPFAVPLALLSAFVLDSPGAAAAAAVSSSPSEESSTSSSSSKTASTHPGGHRRQGKASQCISA